MAHRPSPPSLPLKHGGMHWWWFMPRVSRGTHTWCNSQDGRDVHQVFVVLLVRRMKHFGKPFNYQWMGIVPQQSWSWGVTRMAKSRIEGFNFRPHDFARFFEHNGLHKKNHIGYLKKFFNHDSSLPMVLCNGNRKKMLYMYHYISLGLSCCLQLCFVFFHLFWVDY